MMEQEKDIFPTQADIYHTGWLEATCEGARSDFCGASPQARMAPRRRRLRPAEPPGLARYRWKP